MKASESVKRLKAADLSAYDDELYRGSKDRTKGRRERTRLLIMFCAARLLKNNPTRRFVVEDILEEASISRGTFYNHFHDCNDLIAVLLADFFQTLWSPRLSRKKHASIFDAMAELNYFYCATYALNSEMFTAYARFMPGNEALIKARAEINSKWTTKVVRGLSIKRKQSFSPTDTIRIHGLVRLLIGLTSDALRERYVYRDPTMVASFPTPETLAESITSIWYTTLAPEVEVRKRGRRNDGTSD